MKSFLVVGLESSGTKIVSRMLAFNLGLIDDISNWDGNEYVHDNDTLVVHKSLPHHYRDNFLSKDFFRFFTKVIVVTRDWGASLQSKINTHNPNVEQSTKEHTIGVSVIKDILNDKKIDSYIFSYESAVLLQENYTIDFMKTVGIKNPQHVEFINMNSKYQKEI